MLGLGPAAPAEPPSARGGFSGYSSGAVVAVRALEPSRSAPLVEATVGRSVAAVDSRGLAGPVEDELAGVGRPAALPPGAKSYGRGAGVDLAVGGGSPLDLLPLPLPATVDAAAPPDKAARRAEAAPLPVNPLLSATLLRAEAAPVWSDASCVLGQPLGFGLGSAADVRILDVPPVGAAAGLVGGRPPDRAVGQSRSFTHLMPNGDGSFGLVAETRQTLAPVTIFGGTAQSVIVEVLGEVSLRVAASGKPGGSTIRYGPTGDPAPSAPILRIGVGDAVIQLTVAQVFGSAPLVVPLAPGLQALVGGRPRRPAPSQRAVAEDEPPEQRPDGTRGAAAVDLARITLLQQPPGARPRLAEVRVGHLEASAAVPPGGVACPLPVRKEATPTLIDPGGRFRWLISIPSSAAVLAGIRCDLVDIRAVDTTSAPSGVEFALLSASHGGRIDGNVIRWPSLGRYRPGDPPLVLEVEGQVASGSSAGFLRDTVVVDAGLDACTGGAAGASLTSTSAENPQESRAATRLNGVFTLLGPETGRPDGL